MLCDWPSGTVITGTAITGIVTIGITTIGAGIFPIFGCRPGAGLIGDGGIITGITILPPLR
jgi:hypothetical protein